MPKLRAGAWGITMEKVFGRYKAVSQTISDVYAAGAVAVFGPGTNIPQCAQEILAIPPPRAAHSAKIRSTAAIRASDLVHEAPLTAFRPICMPSTIIGIRKGNGNTS